MRLTESTNKILSLASVIGREFDLALLEQIAEMPEDAILDAIDEAKAAALVAEVGGEVERYAFTHALVRATLYDDISPARRARMHRRVGAALELLTETQPGQRVDELARHWMAATTIGELVQGDRLCASGRRAGAGRPRFRGGGEILRAVARRPPARRSRQRPAALRPHDRAVRRAAARRRSRLSPGDDRSGDDRPRAR